MAPCLCALGSGLSPESLKSDGPHDQLTSNPAVVSNWPVIWHLCGLGRKSRRAFAESRRCALLSFWACRLPCLPGGCNSAAVLVGYTGLSQLLSPAVMGSDTLNFKFQSTSKTHLKLLVGDVALSIGGGHGAHEEGPARQHCELQPRAEAGLQLEGQHVVLVEGPACHLAAVQGDCGAACTGQCFGVRVEGSGFMAITGLAVQDVQSDFRAALSSGGATRPGRNVTIQSSRAAELALSGVHAAHVVQVRGACQLHGSCHVRVSRRHGSPEGTRAGQGP